MKSFSTLLHTTSSLFAMFSKALLAQSRTLSVSLKARASFSSLVLLRHASPKKLSMPLQWQRALSTSLALRSEESRPDDYNPKPRGFRRSNPPSGTIYIGNLPYSVTEEELRESFAEFGEIVRVALGVFFRAALVFLRKFLTVRAA